MVLKVLRIEAHSVIPHFKDIVGLNILVQICFDIWHVKIRSNVINWS